MSFRTGGKLDLGMLPDRSFDAVYMNSAFHRIESHEARVSALAHIFRILKPGGRVGLSDPDQASPGFMRTILHEVLGNYGIHSWAVNGLTSADIESLLVRGGFRIQNVEYTRNSESPLAILDTARSGYFGNYLPEVPEELHDQVQREIAQKLSEFQTSIGILLVCRRALVVAEKPDGPLYSLY